jgi:hypothetical protein
MSTGQWVNGNLIVNAITTLTSPIISGQVGTLGVQTGDVLLNFDEFWVQRGRTHDAGTKRFTVPIDGFYRITLTPFFSATGGARLLIGTTDIGGDAPTSSVNIGQCYREDATYDNGYLNSVVQLNGGDYIVFRLQSGIIHNASDDRFNQFSIEYIG